MADQPKPAIPEPAIPEPATPSPAPPPPVPEIERMRQELAAIEASMNAMATLDPASKKRVIWYIADTFGLSQSPQPQARPVPVAPVPISGGPRTRSIPIPAGTDPKAVQQAIGNAGLPSSR